jgi:hypothetical protein
VQRRYRGGAGEVQGRCRGCRDGAGYLHHLHLNKHDIRCREVQEVQAHLRYLPERMVHVIFFPIQGSVTGGGCAMSHSRSNGTARLYPRNSAPVLANDRG